MITDAVPKPCRLCSPTRSSLRTEPSKTTVVHLVSIKREQTSAKRPYTTTSRKCNFGHLQPNCNDVILSNVTCSGRILRCTNPVNSLNDHACTLQSIPLFSTPTPMKGHGNEAMFRIARRSGSAKSAAKRKTIYREQRS